MGDSLTGKYFKINLHHLILITQMDCQSNMSLHIKLATGN